MHLNPFKRDSFGYNLLIKRTVIFVFGLITWYRFFRINSTRIVGADKLRDLPNQGVLFVSNHQTYFADVSAMYQVFNAAVCSASVGVIKTSMSLNCMQERY